MSRLPRVPGEKPAERWARLHRRIIESGRIPAMTLDGCELQAKMLDSGELQPLPRPGQRLASSKEMRRVMENDERQREDFDTARWHSQDEEAADTAADPYSADTAAAFENGELTYPGMSAEWRDPNHDADEET